jgi:hypothetical protein
MLGTQHIRFVQPPAWAPPAGATPPPSAAPAEPLQLVLGRRLRWLRVERGLSRKAVAARLRLPVALVERHERGTGQIKAEQLVAYARLFGVRISLFFCDPPTSASA